METYYYPHHARLENAVEQALTRHDHCLIIIDVHSFSSAPLPHELDRTPRLLHPSALDLAALQYRPHERAGCAKERAFRKQVSERVIRIDPERLWASPAPAHRPRNNRLALFNKGAARFAVIFRLTTMDVVGSLEVQTIVHVSVHRAV